MIAAVHKHRVAKHAFPDKAEFLIQAHGAQVVGPDAELDANETRRKRLLQRSIHEPGADAAAAIVRNNAHAERSAVGMGREGMPLDIAPANHFAVGDGHEHRVALG